MPEKTESGVLAFLRKSLIALLVIMLSVPLGLVLQRTWVSLASGDHEVVLPPVESVLWGWFVIGVVFALFVFILVDSLLGFLRKRIKT